MTDKIEAAMTPEEWKCLRVVRDKHDGRGYVKIGDGWVVEGFVDDGEEFDCGEVVYSDPRTRHALAARALHGQPFGFTREDVEILKAIHKEADILLDNRPPGYWNDTVSEVYRRLNSLADRIEALLPPEEP